MRHGLVLLTDPPWREVRPRWAATEAMGFDHAWTYDHLIWGGLPEAPWTGAVPALAAAAGVTDTIGLGTFVASPVRGRSAANHPGHGSASEPG